MAIETTFKTGKDANIYAGPFSFGGMFFGVSDKGGGKLSVHLTIDQAKTLIGKLQGAIIEEAAVARAKAEVRAAALTELAAADAELI